MPSTGTGSGIDVEAGERGSLTYADSVMERIVSLSATEVTSVVSTGSRLDQVVGHRYPKADVRVAGQHVWVAVELAVVWPASLPETAARARDHIGERVAFLTGLVVDVVDVTIAQMTRAQRSTRERVQ